MRYNDDEYYRQFGADRRREGHQVELTAGITALRFVSHFDIGGALLLSRQLNRYYEIGNDVTNLNLQLSVKWRIK